MRKVSEGKANFCFLLREDPNGKGRSIRMDKQAFLAVHFKEKPAPDEK